MVHTNPVPGCETENMWNFSETWHVHRENVRLSDRCWKKLLDGESLRAQMQEVQKRTTRPEAAERICKLLEELTGNKENRIIDLEIIKL